MFQPLGAEGYRPRGRERAGNVGDADDLVSFLNTLAVVLNFMPVCMVTLETTPAMTSTAKSNIICPLGGGGAWLFRAVSRKWLAGDAPLWRIHPGVSPNMGMVPMYQGGKVEGSIPALLSHFPSNNFLFYAGVAMPFKSLVLNLHLAPPHPILRLFAAGFADSVPPPTCSDVFPNRYISTFSSSIRSRGSGWLALSSMLHPPAFIKSKSAFSEE